MEIDFTEINPDQMNNEELEALCAEVLDHHRDLIGMCVNHIFVLQCLKSKDRRRRQDGLWQIKGAAKARARSHRSAGGLHRPAARPHRTASLPAGRLKKKAERRERDRARTFATRGDAAKRR